MRWELPDDTMTNSGNYLCLGNTTRTGKNREGAFTSSLRNFRGKSPNSVCGSTNSIMDIEGHRLDGLQDRALKRRAVEEAPLARRPMWNVEKCVARTVTLLFRIKANVRGVHRVFKRWWPEHLTPVFCPTNRVSKLHAISCYCRLISEMPDKLRQKVERSVLQNPTRLPASRPQHPDIFVSIKNSLLLIASIYERQEAKVYRKRKRSTCKPSEKLTGGWDGTHRRGEKVKRKSVQEAKKEARRQAQPFYFSELGLCQNSDSRGKGFLKN